MSHLSIDWRRPLKVVEPFVQGRGGIVLVSGGHLSAAQTFLSLLREKIVKSNGLTIQFNPIDPNTRSPGDIVRFLEFKLGLGQNPIGSISILSDVAAGRDVNFNNVTIEMSNASNLDWTRLESLTKSAETMLSTRRVCLFFVDSAAYPSGTAHWLVDDLWNQCLSALAPRGLVAFVLTAPGGPASLFNGHSDVAAIVDLPDIYAADDLQHAIDDVATILSSSGTVEKPSALDSAKVFLAAMEYRPQSVHNGLAATLTRLCARRDPDR